MLEAIQQLYLENDEFHLLRDNFRPFVVVLFQRGVLDNFLVQVGLFLVHRHGHVHILQGGRSFLFHCFNGIFFFLDSLKQHKVKIVKIIVVIFIQKQLCQKANSRVKTTRRDKRKTLLAAERGLRALEQREEREWENTREIGQIGIQVGESGERMMRKNLVGCQHRRGERYQMEWEREEKFCS